MFRAYQGRSLDELPYRASCGVWGSYICLFVSIIALIAQFYVALYPIGGPNLDVKTFFQLYLAGPLFVFLFLLWKIYAFFVKPEDRRMWVPIKNIDIYSGMREEQRGISGLHVSEDQRRASIQQMTMEKKRGPKNYLVGAVRNIF